MLGTDISVQAVPVAAATAALKPSQPQPETRVVERSTRSTLQQQSGSSYTPTGSSLERLAASARQFAEVLDTTGSVQVASSVSGFRVGFLDTYA